MFIRFDNEGIVSIIEDGEATYQATPEEFAADAPGVVLVLPPGCHMAVLETTTGVITGYDAKAQAFPGIKWDGAADLLSRATTLKAAHVARGDALKAAQVAAEAAAAGGVAPEMVRPKEVVPDTEDLATKTEVTVL